ncbi:MAG TPA: hypothetical protein VK789_28405 [Bryobacteraceae bacterium]|nr:hypothetical protein [Bryobacteraceae bacterium]
MKCLFYAHVLHQLMSGEWIILQNPGSNQCALITDAHSPCSMEVTLNKAPEWTECPRNPTVNGTGPAR